MTKRKPTHDETGSLFRMLEEKLELERAFGVEVVPTGKEQPASSSPRPPAGGEGQGEGGAGEGGTAPTARGRGTLRDSVSSARPDADAASSSPRPPAGGEGQVRPERSRRDEGGKQAEATGSKAERLAALEAELAECMECALGQTRTNLVFGEGNPDADILFIGEAPGADEDAQGRPFVGRAGQLLTKVINAMGLTRSDVYIANILKCRPPGNRDPRPSEVVSCLPVLRHQIRIIDPKVIVCLGGVSAKTLLQTDMPVGRLRGTFHDYEGIPLLVTYHTAYLLRNPAGKAQVWDDMKKVLHKLGLPIPEK